MSTSHQPQSRRRAAKDVRRRQLIEATIESIAKRGLGDTTLAHISQTAGLSQGIVNLHFTSKENLLNATLEFLRDEYELAWQSALARSADDPACQLSALLRADYQAGVAGTKKLAVWFAFWGEVKARPAYQRICQERVNAYTGALEKILVRLIKQGRYDDLNVSLLAEGIMAMADGLWLNMLVSARNLKRAEAEKVMLQYLAQIFPQHKRAFV